MPDGRLLPDSRRVGLTLIGRACGACWFRADLGSWVAVTSSSRRRLIRFAELFRGSGDRVTVPAREIVREVLRHRAEQLLRVRSGPQGDHQPTVHDVEDAPRVKRALDLLSIPLVDYVIVGGSATSLRQRGII